jgi:hypothetical protein
MAQKTAVRLHCDQCQALMINGVFCHETGCPNSNKTWVAEREAWVRFLECRECGCDVEAGESCDCQDEPEGCDDCMTYPCSCEEVVA